MTQSDLDDLTMFSRITAAITGCLMFGRAAELHVLVALVLIGVWLHYTATTHPRRAWALLGIGLSAGWMIKQMQGPLSW
jgi:hypothetical protein